MCLKGLCGSPLLKDPFLKQQQENTGTGQKSEMKLCSFLSFMGQDQASVAQWLMTFQRRGMAAYYAC